MLAYILLKREVRREELIALFWSDLPEQKARNAFRQTLHRLRKGLGEALVSRGPASLAVEGGESLSVDLFDFEHSLQRGDFEAALHLYRGPFLEGMDLGERDFDNWVLGERARLDARYQWALEQAVAAASSAGDTETALARAALLSKSAPLAAGAALREASLLIAAGRNSEARSNLEQFSQRYRAEFGEDPPHEIKESLARLRKDSSAPATSLDVDRQVLVGRDREMARLLSVWTETQAGRANLVLVDGPDGIGKTAIVEEFLSRISKIGPVLALAGRERSSGALLPYASIGQALRGVLTAPGLAGASQHLLAEAARLLPELHDHFDLPPVQNVEDETSQLRFFEGIAALLDAVAYEQPVCLVLDDFHSAAPTTVQLVEYLCGRLSAVAVAIILVFRTSSVSASRASGFPFGLRDSGQGNSASGLIPVMRLSVSPLEIAESEILVRSVAEADVLPAEECHRIASLSGGVPFRILDMARQAAGGLRVSALPATLQESLWARLQGCSPAQQRLFVASALIERPASIKLLAGASHLSESAAFDAVIALEARGLLRQTPQGVTPEHHEAAQFALMGTGPAGRALLAGWAADALASEPNPRAGELAHLFNVAGNGRECFKYAIAAAYEAAGLSEEASVKHFLALAESAAATPADRSKIDAVRRLLEPNHTRLLSGETAAISDADIAEKPARAVSQEIPASVIVPVPVRVLLKTLMRSPPVQIASALAIGVLLALAGLSAGRSRGVKAPAVPDTLFLVNRSAQESQIFFVTGEITPGSAVPQAYSKTVAPTWMDSLALPYMNPAPSPDGLLVAVERMKDTGPDILLFSSNGKLFREAAGDPGDDIIAGWSPDGRWLLATHGQSIADGNYDADLFAISANGRQRIPLDTSTSRSIVEAAWSPDGTHIAWTARVGATHQQEVYVANADGTGLVNISKSPEEDYHVVWANDGGRIAFTSNRFGNADIFAYELSTQKLLRLTGDSGQDDYAVFSPDGNFLAFESTADGISSVSVVRSWGGNPFRVAGGDRSFAVRRWGNRSQSQSYIASVRIAGSAQVPLSRNVEAVVLAANAANFRLPSPSVRWANLDPALVDLTPGSDTSAILTGIRAGLARIAISAGGWRTDTALFRIGNARIDLIADAFNSGVSKSTWSPVGDSAPQIKMFNGNGELSAKSGRQRESGVLSRTRLPFYSGFFVRAAVRAPLRAPTAQRSFTIALVSEDSSAIPGSQQKRLATIQWVGQAARIAYSVDRETWTEPLGTLADKDQHVFEMLVDAEGKVSFNIDGKQHWRSRLRIPNGTQPGRLWLGSQGAADLVSFDNVQAGLQPQTVR
jgi:DNA-binding SARP family transcriptional activator